MHRAERPVYCRLIRSSSYGASCLGEILRFSTVSLPEGRKKRGADVDFQAVWAHVSNQKLQVRSRGASDLWRESVRNAVSVHQDKILGTVIPERRGARAVQSCRPRSACSYYKLRALCFHVRVKTYAAESGVLPRTYNDIGAEPRSRPSPCRHGLSRGGFGSGDKACPRFRGWVSDRVGRGGLSEQT